MAWEDFERNGESGMTGDKPIDEMAIALKRIAVAYQDRFDRKPKVVEIVHALENVLTTTPSQFVSDITGLTLGQIVVERKEG